MAEVHDFDNTVVAILDREPSVRDAAEGLSEAGYRFEVIAGEEGRDHIDPEGDTGLIAGLKRLAGVFGDQYRIMDRLDEALAEGRIVISVEFEDEDPKEAIEILREHGGHYMWKLGEWTFNRIGD